MNMQTSAISGMASQIPVTDLQAENCEDEKMEVRSIDPMTLAYLDFGLFKSLIKLDVSRERVCSALSLSYEDFDYIHMLSHK